VLAIEVAYWPGNEFGLWMPETVFVSGKTVWGNWWEDAHQDFEQDPRGRWVTRRVFDQFTITSVLAPDPARSCLWYRHTFENTGRATLQGLNTQTCFHLVNAPQFISLQGSRIWASLDGRWMTTDRVERERSPDPRRVVFLREGLRKERTVVSLKGFPRAMMPEAAHHPLFIAENFEGNGSVGIASRHFEQLFNNNDPILRCLHSEPMPIAELEPGRKAHQDAALIFCKGDHQGLLGHYQRRIASSWPAD